MRPITLARAAAWLGVALVGWSINLRWGADPNLPPGPPVTVERAVVGALLLGFIAALALSFAGRGGKPPGWLGKGLALAGAGGTVAIALYVRSDVRDTALGGSGWTWLMVGAAMLLLAAAGVAALRAPADASQRNRGRRRARAR